MKTVAIAGAGGFIGRTLIDKALRAKFHIVGLSRSAPPGHTDTSGIEWRRCDLYSLLDAEAALEGVDYAVYLVHSMLPSARLIQGNFADTDLILADNFARAARKNKLKHIVYLGGIIPNEGEAEDETKLSEHLRSRLEVERTLGGRGTPLTAVRAGLVVGPGGSSFSILEKLVQRLPMMICPAWTNTRSQPVALEDVITAIDYCIGRKASYGRSLDVAGPDVLTYREMMEITAKSMGLRRFLLTVPFFSPRLSKLWVSLFSGASMNLVSPLIESLKHEMVARPDPLTEKMPLKRIGFREAVQESVHAPQNNPSPFRIKRLLQNRYRVTKFVRSIQRLPRPAGRDALWIAREYGRWLPRFLWPFLRVTTNDNGDCAFFIRGLPFSLLELELSSERSSPDRQLYYITGGILAEQTRRGRLEFRIVPDGESVLAAIHDFAPALPWFVYNYTQALVHLMVMRHFGRHLDKLDRLAAVTVKKREYVVKQ